MTLAGDLLLQVRVDKGYGHSRVAFVAHFGISWGEHTQRFLEVGRTIMREDIHLTHLVEIGLVQRESTLHHQFRAAIVYDRQHKYQNTKSIDEPRTSRPLPFWTSNDGETEEELRVREIFEALQIEGLFDSWGVEVFSLKRSDASTGWQIPHTHAGQSRMKRKLPDTAIVMSAG